MAMNRSHRLTGVDVLPFTGETDLICGCDVYLRGGLIEAVQPAGSPPPTNSNYETHRFKNAIVMPGLTNAHSHSVSTLYRGRIPAVPLDLFMWDLMSWPMDLSAERIRTATLLHGIELLKGGVTAVVDHLFAGPHPTAEIIEVALAAYEQLGIRARVAPMYQDIGFFESLPSESNLVLGAKRGSGGIANKQYFDNLAAVAMRWSGHERCNVALGIEGPQRCSPELLEQAGSFLKDYDLPFHTHLLESKTQALMAQHVPAGSFVEYLDSFGLVGPKTSFAHFVWCTDRDIEIAAERGAIAVNNPVSNLYLGSGIQPTMRLKDCGVRLAYGSDGSASNRINMFEQAKFSMLLSRVSEIDCDKWMSARDSAEILVEGGVAVLGLVSNCGYLAPGAAADLVILELSASDHRPLGDIWSHLIMYETGKSVSAVFVSGDVVLKDGKCTKINEEAIYAAAETIAASEFKSKKKRENLELKGYVTNWMKAKLPISRLACEINGKSSLS